MKIKKIELKNFRQFYGEQSLVLSTDSAKNVTLIHAENTVGKTTLLNSVLWAFFELTTKKFENAEDILCHDAASEGQALAKVTVDFIDEDDEYTVSRIFNKGAKDTKLSVHKIVQGDHKRIEAAQTLIGSIIPKPMAKYFFFDGEAAETFSAEGNRQEVRKAVRDILGCSFVDVARADLKEIKKRLNAEIQGATDDKDLEEIEEKIARLTLEIEQREALIATHVTQVDIVINQIAEIDNYLKESQAAALLQKERNDFERTRAQALQNLAISKTRIIEWLAEEGQHLVAREAASTVIEFLKKENSKGVIPSPYNEEFVKGLLSDKFCICGRHLTAGSDEYAKVLDMLKTASDATTRDRIQRIRSVATETLRRAKKAPELLKNALGDRERHSKQISDIEAKIGEIGEQIGAIDVAEIQQKEDRRRKLQRDLQSLHSKIAEYKFKNEEDSDQLRTVERFRDNALSQNSRLRPLKLRLDLVDRAIVRLAEATEAHESAARKEIMKMVNGILGETSRNNYRAALEPDFSLVMKTPNGLEIGKSGGENQLISLAFISALIRFCASRTGSNPNLDPEQLLIPGTIAPLMLDAPFGQLDNTYKKATVEFLPKLAEQMVLFVTSSQGGDLVRDLLKDRIGAEYILVRENRTDLHEETSKNRPSDEITIDGRAYRRAYYNRPHDMTRIEKIS